MIVRRLRFLVLVASLSAMALPALGALQRFRYERLENPDRTVVTEPDGRWVATFTDRTSTVTLWGRERTFREATAADPVRTTTWVRLLPEPFNGQVDEAWLVSALKDESPDVLHVATQYFAGAPPIRDEAGRRVAGDAGYGPKPEENVGSDFNDYLGIPWKVAVHGVRRRPRIDVIRLVVVEDPERGRGWRAARSVHSSPRPLRASPVSR